jgi:predicted membrane protein
MDADSAARRRDRLLLLNAVGFVVWQAGMFGPHLIGSRNAPGVIVVGLGGFLLWAISLVLLLRSPSDARVRQVLDDELTQHHRHRAMLTGYWLMLATAAGAMTLAAVAPTSAVLALRAVVVVGVAAPLIRFVILERRVGG